jgi:hypothetical protein
MLGAKLIWTTLIAGPLFALIAAAYSYRLVSLDVVSDFFGLPPSRGSR